ncbi:GNAT family N-acetyltransferase [Yoonia sp. 2307UL14-13]|uniref:GNAT family N-acetyltransferase n=1 Tax=Yoonia sp. 2307UL14-13 TaxID=3126506 RepID=UPI0030ADC195
MLIENWQITSLGKEDIPQAAALSRSFLWPHQPSDWDFMLALGTGWKVAQGDDLLGTLMCWTYGRDQAALGMIMTRSDMQRRRIGKQLMDHAFAELPDRQLSLIATREGQPLYKKCGFRVSGEITKSQGQSLGASETGEVITDATLDAISVLDCSHSGLDRRDLLAALMKVSDVALIRGEGYALCRPFGPGRVIGPVMASDEEAAKALIAHFLRRYKGEIMRIDTPTQHDLADWLNTHGLTPVDTAVAMARGDSGPPDKRGVIALISQAFG